MSFLAKQLKEAKEVTADPEGRWFPFCLSSDSLLLLEKRSIPEHLSALECLDKATAVEAVMRELEDMGEATRLCFSVFPHHRLFWLKTHGRYLHTIDTKWNMIKWWWYHMVSHFLAVYTVTCDSGLGETSNFTSLLQVWRWLHCFYKRLGVCLGCFERRTAQEETQEGKGSTANRRSDNKEFWLQLECAEVEAEHFAESGMALQARQPAGWDQGDHACAPRLCLGRDARSRIPEHGPDVNSKYDAA